MDGVDYHFLQREDFLQRIDRGEMLEYALVHGNYYGTLRNEVEPHLEKGVGVILDIDVQGAAQIKSKLSDAVSIFILPPNRSELEQRLRRRSQDSESVIQRRLYEASREIENYGKYDYILVNDRLADSVEALKAILLSQRLKRQGRTDAALSATAEKYRLENVRHRLQPILQSFGKTAASVK